MDHNSMDNDMEEIKMGHSKIEIDSVVNDCDNVQSLDNHMRSELDTLNQTNNSAYDASLLMQHHDSITSEEITAHLASSGMAGVAAAAAIATSQRKTMLYNFETVPAVRKRHSTRLLRKIQHLVDEFSVRVGQQACLLVCSPKSAYKSPNDAHSNSVVFKVFGASPLDNVLRNLRDVITQDLETALENYSIMNTSVSFYQPTEVLPPLMVDGIPTPLDKMTQAQLRAFIPVMLKYSTGRIKPAWGRPASRPPWWPDDVPWANVRSDVRTDEEKQRQSWTNALKKVVRCCYEYHGKSQYLYDYNNSSLLNHPEMLEHHNQIIDMEGHHPTSVDYTSHHHHEHIQNQVSGRHMLLNEQDAVEAQLRAIQSTYSMPSGHDGSIIINLDGNDHDNQQNDHIQITNGNINEFNLGNDPSMRGDGQHIKVEDLVNFPPGTVVQLDSNSTAELFNLLASSGASNHHQGNEIDVTSHERNHQIQQHSSSVEHHSSNNGDTHSSNISASAQND